MLLIILSQTMANCCLLELKRSVWNKALRKRMWTKALRERMCWFPGIGD